MEQKNMFAVLLLMLLLGIGVQAQTKRSDDFRKKYELKEVVVSAWPMRWLNMKPSSMQVNRFLKILQEFYFNNLQRAATCRSFFIIPLVHFLHHAESILCGAFACHADGVVLSSRSVF